MTSIYAWLPPEFVAHQRRWESMQLRRQRELLGKPIGCFARGIALAAAAKLARTTTRSLESLIMEFRL